MFNIIKKGIRNIQVYLISIQSSLQFSIQFARQQHIQYNSTFDNIVVRMLSLTKCLQLSELPVPQSKRTFTDLLCVILFGGLFISLIIASFCIYNYDHYYKSSLPADSDGRVCSIDLPGYPYLYFANLPSIERRVCVSQCPKQADQKLACTPTTNTSCRWNSAPNYIVSYYESEETQTQAGNFCMPTDQSAAFKLSNDITLSSRISFFSQISTILFSALISLIVAAIYLVIVHFLPKTMNYAAIIIGLVFMSGMIIIISLYKTDQNAARIAILIILVVVFFMIVVGACRNKSGMKLHGVFLKHSTRVLSQNPTILVILPVFLVLLTLFSLLLTMELRSFWSASTLHPLDSSISIYHELADSDTTASSVLIGVEALWGFMLIKEMFNFIVSYCAVYWYFQKQDEGGVLKAVKLMFRKHIGSVIACSFMTSFFAVFDYIYDFFRPDSIEDGGCYRSIYSKCCTPFDNFFNLVRSDSMSAIALIGNPFCNASRYTQFLCFKSLLTRNSQSTSRSYRICAHFLLCSIVASLALLSHPNTSLYVLLFILFQGYFIVTGFISLHADVAEAIQVCLLVDEEFERRTEEDRGRYVEEELMANLKLRKSVVADIREIK